MDEGFCDAFWGSHACDLPPGHDGTHVCMAEDPDGPCSIHDGTSMRSHLGDGLFSEAIDWPLCTLGDIADSTFTATWTSLNLNGESP